MPYLNDKNSKRVAGSRKLPKRQLVIISPEVLTPRISMQV